MSSVSEIYGAVDERTLQLLERRRRPTGIRRRGWLVRRLLVSADIVGLSTAMVIAEVIVTATTSAGAFDARMETLALVATLPLWVVVAKLYGLYDRDEERTDHSTADDFAGVFHMVTVCTWMFWALSRLTEIVRPTAPKLLIFWFSAIVLVTIGRSVARTAARRSVTYLQNAVVVGAGEVGQMIARKLLQHPEYGVNLVGFVDRDPKDRDDDLNHLALLGEPDFLPSLVPLFDIERVIIAFSNESHQETLKLVRALKDQDVQIDIVPRLFETVGPRVGIHMVEGLPLVGLPPLRLSRSSLLLKRMLDLVVASVALIVLLPVLVAVAVAVKLSSAGPVLYMNECVGRNGHRFRAIKFRTMRPDASDLLDALLSSDALIREQFDRTLKLPRDPRVTPLGTLLRRSSLDELPQLFNVLRGDMSLVGARAINTFEYDRYFGANDQEYGPVPPYWEYDLRPGLTGYWQINGRSSIDYADRLRLDATYVANWSMRLDLEILAKTARVLVARRGAT